MNDKDSRACVFMFHTSATLRGEFESSSCLVVCCFDCKYLLCEITFLIICLDFFFVSDWYFFCLQEGDLKYTLYGVLVHHGWSTHSGHYYCFVRTSSGMWYSLDDNRVLVVSLCHF